MVVGDKYVTHDSGRIDDPLASSARTLVMRARLAAVDQRFPGLADLDETSTSWPGPWPWSRPGPGLWYWCWSLTWSLTWSGA